LPEIRGSDITFAHFILLHLVLVKEHVGIGPRFEHHLRDRFDADSAQESAQAEALN
jgi:hypothetical protein